MQDTDKKISTSADLSGDDIDIFARDVIRGLFGLVHHRKDLLGENYQKIQDRVNEILRNKSIGDTKLSETEGSNVEKVGEEAIKKVEKATAEMNMDVIYAVYGDKKQGSSKTSKRAKTRR